MAQAFGLGHAELLMIESIFQYTRILNRINVIIFVKSIDFFKKWYIILDNLSADRNMNQREKGGIFLKRKSMAAKCLSLLLCVCLTVTTMLTGAAPALARDLASYTQTFDTEDISNWKQAHGESVMSVADGRFSVETAEGNENKYQPQYALVYDENAPVLSDGEISAKMFANFAGRFGLVFRYQDKDNYQFVGYDYGNWIVKERKAGKEQTWNITGGSDPRNGQEFELRAVFTGSNLKVYLDDTLLYNEDVLSDDMAGKLGVRTWGYAGNYAKVSIDTLSYQEVIPPEKDEDGNYMVSFTDEDRRGGWAVESGGGSLAFTDGEGENGYMVAAAGPDGADNGNTFFSDRNAPSIDNGFLEFDVTNQAEGRIGFLFRYNDTSHFAGILYDIGGTWNWAANGSNGTIISGGPVLENGVKHHIRIEYVGENIRLLIDGQEAFNQKLPQLDIGSGRIGLRVWGYGSGSTMGSAKLDNIVNGEFNAVLLDPAGKFVLRAEAGSYDIPVILSQTDNALSKLIVGETELVEGTDYSVNEARDTVTIKKEYIAKVKENGDTDINFVFADGYIATFSLQVQGAPDEEVSYARDFTEGYDGFELVSGSANLEANADKGSLSVSNGSGAFLIDENSPNLRNSEVEFEFDPKNDSGNFAVVLRYRDQQNWTAVGVDGIGGNHTNWYVYTGDGKKTALFGNGDSNLTKGDGDGQRVYSNRVEPYKIKVRLVENTITIYLDNTEICNTTVEGLTSGAGKSGIRYTSGAGADLYYMTVDTSNPLEAETSEVTEQTIASEKMTVALDNDFPRVIRYEMDGKTLSGQEKPYYLVGINSKMYRPEVTSSFTDDTATYHLTVAVSKEKSVSFDVVFRVENNVLSMDIQNVDDSQFTVHTFSFPNQSLVSMSSAAPNAKLRESNYTTEQNIDLTARRDNDNHSYTTLAVLSSDELAATINCGSIKSRSEICYQTFINGDHFTTGLWPNEFQYKGLDNDLIKGGTWAKVAIAGDRNQDGKVDYQDGAIALRDDIPTVRVNSSDIFNAYTSIAVNEASWAQHPFLKTLDIVKKMSLGMDNFPQNVVYKGYQTQGHDSSHPDFAAINEQAGGEEDFRTLIEGAQNYNTTIGVHINETEAYPEAKQFGALASANTGWSWFDTAQQMVRENDILSAYADQIPGGNMEARLDALQDVTQTETNGLGLIYVDTYFDTRWPAYRLSEKINENGWALATEYVDEFTKNSVWAHHIGSSFNNAGNLVRFVNNGTQDIFGYSSLFRGPNDRHSTGIYGWQADTVYGQNYQKTIEDFFIRILPNKYMANFPINQWENNDQVTFGYNNEVVSKMVNGVNQITSNGRLIADGNKIFIPWDPQTEEKIYHWNPNGGESTWTLPESWNDQATVKLYKLSDQGRTEEQVLTVSDHQVTIDAAANTGYVVYKGTSDVQPSDLTTYNWSEGSPVKDTGFNSYTWGYAWEKTSTADNTEHITFSTDNTTNIGQGDTNVLVQGENDATLTQTMTGLIPGQTYSASVFVDVNDNRRAEIAITTPDGKTVSNYTEHYYRPYGSSHSDKKQSRYQRIKVQFTQPEGATTAVIQLKAGQGTADSYVRFDDVRIYEIEPTDLQGHYYFEDFENFDVGYGPFEAGISGQNHMSETSDFTSDTISGRYSLKIRNFSGGNLSARTSPATLRLAPNTTYTLSMDYMSSQTGAYVLSAREGDQELASYSLDGTGYGSANVKTAVMQFTTGDSGEAYLDIATGSGGELILDNLAIDMVDNQVPTQPANVKAENVTDTSAAISWDASTDNVGVVGYEVAVNGEVVDTVTDLNILLTDLAPNTNYTVTVVALDQAGNRSEAGVTTFTTAASPAPVDKSELGKVIEESKTYDLDKYVDGEAKESFKAALDKAQQVYDDPDATQAEVDEQWLNLINAGTKLRLRADKSSLDEWLDKLKGIDLSKYTAESAEAVRLAITAAEELAAQDLGIDQADQILASINIMKQAFDGLVLSEEAPAPDSSTPGVESSGKPDTSPTTGDVEPFIYAQH